MPIVSEFICKVRKYVRDDRPIGFSCWYFGVIGKVLVAVCFTGSAVTNVLLVILENY